MSLAADIVGLGLSSVQVKMLGDVPQLGVVANGTTQGTATLLTGNIVQVVTTVAGVNDGVRLPPRAELPQSLVLVRNTHAAATVRVWPAAGESMNALIDTAVSVSAGTARIFGKIPGGWLTT